MDNKKVRVAITQGDTNGIGYELIFKTFSSHEMLELCTPIIYGLPKVAVYHCNVLGLEANFSIIKDLSEVEDNRINLIPIFDEEQKVEMGHPTEESGVAGLRAIDYAINDFKNGGFDAMVLSPIENTDVFQFSGQIQYIEDHLSIDQDSLFMLINNFMRIGFITQSIPLNTVTEMISAEKIYLKGKQMFDSILSDFRISNPRIAVLSINPRAGENGHLGTEEKELITPAIDKLVENGMQVFGPYAADKFFGGNDWDKFDGILAMYYDQGYIPFRSLSTQGSIGYMAGMPLIVTLPATLYTNYDAGKGIVDEQSMRQAIYTSIDIYRNRITYNEPLANPLEKLYKEHKDENDKTRFSHYKHTE